MTLTKRHDWTTEEILASSSSPCGAAGRPNRAREANPGYRVQLASLLSVKTRAARKTAPTALSRPQPSDVTAFDAQMQVEPVLKGPGRKAGRSRPLLHGLGLA